MSGKPVLSDYAQSWRELMVGHQLPIQPTSGPPGNPEATPECSAEWRGVEMYGHNANDDTPFSEFP